MDDAHVHILHIHHSRKVGRSLRSLRSLRKVGRSRSLLPRPIRSSSRVQIGAWVVHPLILPLLLLWIVISVLSSIVSSPDVFFDVASWELLKLQVRRDYPIAIHKWWGPCSKGRKEILRRISPLWEMQELQDRFFAMPIGHAPLEFGPVVLESISQLEKNLLICGHRSFVFSVN
jgi:hypothetical protein